MELELELPRLSGQPGSSSQTAVRFRVSARYGGSDEYFFVDNVQISSACSACTTVTVLDEFNDVSFSNNDGPDDWAGSWLENDPEAGGVGPGAGQVQIENGALRLDDQPDTGGEPSAARSVVLSVGSPATLVFDFWTTSGVDASDEVTVEVSSDGGTNFTVLEVIKDIYGATTASRSFDISAYASSQTVVRFRVSALYGGSDEYFFVDNVQISSACSACTSVTVRDEFNDVSFSNNDGPDDWAGGWLENDPEAGGVGPGAGQVQIEHGALRFDDQPDTGGEPSAARSVVLSEGGPATLVFDFWTTSGVDTSDEVTVEVSSDGGTNFTVLEVIKDIYGAITASRSFDISAYASSQTVVRFRVSARYGGSDEYFFVDNVQISSACAD
jgi:hypothetical protein